MPFQRYQSRNTFFALMMALAAFNLRVMPNDLMVKLSAYGISQDHRAVYRASAVACRQVAQIFAYETPSSYPNFVPTIFEPIDDFIERKVAALKLHESQGDRLYMHEEKIRSAAHFRGVQVDLGQTEGFIPYKLVL